MGDVVVVRSVLQPRVGRRRPSSAGTAYVVHRAIVILALQTRPGFQSSVRAPRSIHRLMLLLRLLAPQIAARWLLS